MQPPPLHAADIAKPIENSLQLLRDAHIKCAHRKGCNRQPGERSKGEFSNRRYHHIGMEHRARFGIIDE